jgi:hypothetical protein
MGAIVSNTAYGGGKGRAALVFGAAAGTWTSYVFKYIDRWRHDRRSLVGFLTATVVSCTAVAIVDRFVGDVYWWQSVGMPIMFLVCLFVCVGVYAGTAGSSASSVRPAESPAELRVILRLVADRQCINFYESCGERRQVPHTSAASSCRRRS